MCPGISIIVPVYNTPEQYLRKCIESILNQTQSNIELILVDDGSMDDSGKVCDEYAERDNRVQVIHQQNRGVSVARNSGIAAAAGKWLMFVDADDWIDVDTCEKAIEVAERLDVDALRFAVYSENDGGMKELHYPIENLGTIYAEEKKVLFKCILNPPQDVGTLGTVWGWLWKSAIMQENHVRFLEGYALSEDVVFCLTAIRSMNRFAYLDKCLYHYNKMNYASATSRYRNDRDEYQWRATKKIQQLLRHEIENNPDLRQDFYMLVYRNNIKAPIVQQYMHPGNKDPYMKRRGQCNELINRPLNKDVLNNIQDYTLPFKHRLFIFLTKRRMFWICGKMAVIQQKMIRKRTR